MTTEIRIQRTNEPVLEVRGQVIASATGNRYYVQVIQTTAGGYVLVIGDYVADWQMAHRPSSLTGLLYTLRSFAEVPIPPTVQALVNGWPDSPHIRQDLLETVNDVLQEVSGLMETR